MDTNVGDPGGGKTGTVTVPDGVDLGRFRSSFNKYYADIVGARNPTGMEQVQEELNAAINACREIGEHEAFSS
ncbi:hypothetical protein [Streptosporangium sandarakinum]